MATSGHRIEAVSGLMTEAGAIYGAGFASVYSTSRYTTFSAKLAEVALSLLERHGAPGRNLLDLACGVGAGSTVFAEAGFEVIGVDGSEEMIRRAAQYARTHGVSVGFECQDMRKFRLARPVDAVCCMFDALNYLLSEDELARTFACVARALRPGGLFVFDMNTPHGLATRWGTRDILSTSRPDVVEINQHRYNPDNKTNSTITTIFVRAVEAAGIGSPDLFRRYVEVHRERGYLTEELVNLMLQAGLTPLSIEGVADMTRGIKSGLEPVADDTGRLMVAARRAG